ncbi:MAG: penicillin-binding protein 1A [Gammaproteobacteria bacterium]|nr:penicillin-binding protein 1A [Gammaproteobacteria bacterium]
MKTIRFSFLRLFVGLMGLLVGTGLIAAVAVVLMVSPLLPDIDLERDVQLKVPLRVYAAGGELIGEFGEERRIPVRMAKVPPVLVQAVLAAEDDSFYRHRGVDPLGILRAVVANLRSGDSGQGASTITMQVARNYFLSPEKTYTRKLKEILLAFRLERDLSKDQILELYLNKIFLGHHAYGFASAAQVYYGKVLEDLDVPEIAMLAGLPKAPSRDNPLSNPDNARNRRNYVLRRMHELGELEDAPYQRALAAPLTAARHLAELDLQAHYVAEMVRQKMVETRGVEVYGTGLKVYTTIDAKQQQAADEALRRGLLDYDRRHGYRGPAGRLPLAEIGERQAIDRLLEPFPEVVMLVPAVVLKVAERSATVYSRRGELIELPWEALDWVRYQSADRVTGKPRSAAEMVALGDVVYLEPLRGDSEAPESQPPAWRLAQVPKVSGALVALRSHDGALTALTGGFSFYQSKFNRVIQAQRQPGSNIKPFIYSAALEKGFTAATKVSGAPIVIGDSTLEDVWRPENYSGKFFGPTPLRKALTLSLNLVSVRLLRAIGPRFAINHMEHFGLPRDRLPNNLSLALGSASLTPLEVARAYAVFANGGFRVEPYFIERIEDRTGEVIFRANPTIVCPTCQIIQARQAELRDSPAASPEQMTSSGAEQQAAVQEEETNSTSGDAGSTAAAPAPPQRFAPRAISSENAFVMASMMRDVVRRGTARRALELHRPDIAGKTGTTNEYNDAWFSGFNQELVASAWVGFDTPETLGRREAGGRAALPVWIDFMRTALKDVPVSPWVPPLGLTTAWVNPDTGQATSSADPDAYQEYFILSGAGAAESPPPTALDSEGELPPEEPRDSVAEQLRKSNPVDKKIPEGLF